MTPIKCKNCGETPTLWRAYAPNSWYHKMWTSGCAGCSVSCVDNDGKAKMSLSKEKAIEAWNDLNIIKEKE